ncbi:hypothetical protein EB838_28985, partial [Klebsiella pneumoniae]
GSWEQPARLRGSVELTDFFLFFQAEDGRGDHAERGLGEGDKRQGKDSSMLMVSVSGTAVKTRR